jgi:hypothetical protein
MLSSHSSQSGDYNYYNLGDTRNVVRTKFHGILFEGILVMFGQEKLDVLWGMTPHIIVINHPFIEDGGPPVWSQRIGTICLVPYTIQNAIGVVDVASEMLQYSITIRADKHTTGIDEVVGEKEHPETSEKSM